MTVRNTRAVAQVLEYIDRVVDAMLGVDERDSRGKVMSAGSSIRRAAVLSLGRVRCPPFLASETLGPLARGFR